MIMTSGEIEAIVNENFGMSIRPGQLVGTMEVFDRLASPVEVVVREPSRLVRWNVTHVREFVASRPELQSKLNELMCADLAGKLRHLTQLVTNN
jgi:CRP-like cAMP-binding protein